MARLSGSAVSNLCINIFRDDGWDGISGRTPCKLADMEGIIQVLWDPAEKDIPNAYIIISSGTNRFGNYYERRFYFAGPNHICYFYENNNGSSYATYPSGVHEYTSPGGGGWWRVNGHIIPKEHEG